MPVRQGMERRQLHAGYRRVRSDAVQIDSRVLCAWTVRKHDGIAQMRVRRIPLRRSMRAYPHLSTDSSGAALSQWRSLRGRG